jgi:hypothetical protein
MDYTDLIRIRIRNTFQSHHIYLFLRVPRFAWSLHYPCFFSWRWLRGSRCDREKHRFLDLCSVWQGKTGRCFLNI